MHHFMGLRVPILAQYFSKSQNTIHSWISTFESGGSMERKEVVAVRKKFGEEKRTWLVSLYKRLPILFLDEAKARFQRQFHLSISTSHLCTILHEEGLVRKVLERRAIQICHGDIIRFFKELQSFPWLLSNLVFLDEVGFDNRDMLRRHGYGIKGQKLYFKIMFLLSYNLVMS